MGKALREKCPRKAQAAWKAPPVSVLVFLPDDLFELHRFHTGALELREGPLGLNRCTCLVDVSDDSSST
jgi:hypothetical protein